MDATQQFQLWLAGLSFVGVIGTACISAWAVVKVKEVHTIVNSQRTEMVDKISALELRDRDQEAKITQLEAKIKHLKRP